MKHVFLFLSLLTLSFIDVFGQGRILTISNNPDFNITATTPFQPIDPTLDANLNITTLINELMIQPVVVNESVFFSYETAVIEDVIYNSPFELTISSHNSALMYANLMNDSIGAMSILGATAVIVGTELSWVPIYGLNPPPFYAPPNIRQVEVGSAHGMTIVDGGVYVGVFGTNVPGTSAQIGRNVGTSTANIKVTAGNHVVIQAGGPNSYAKIGFGTKNFGLASDIGVDILVSIEEGNLHVVGGDVDAFAQIGNAHEGGLFLGGDIDVIARSVLVNIPMNGNTFIYGGIGDNSEARIGHWHDAFQADNVIIGGRINLADSSSVVLRSGLPPGTDATVGHYAADGEVVTLFGGISIEAIHRGVHLDAHSFGGTTTHCQVGHSSLSQINIGICMDSIFVNTGAWVNCWSGWGMEEFALIGHRGLSGASDDLSGHIEVNAGDSIAVVADSGIMNYAQIGHHINNAGSTAGNVTVRSGGRQFYSSVDTDDPTSPALLGHNDGLITSDIYALAFDNLDMWSSLSPAGAGVFVRAVDTLRMVTADSIQVLGNEGGVQLSTLGNGSVVRLDAASNIGLQSPGGMEAHIEATDASQIRLQCSGDIGIAQMMLQTAFSTGEIIFLADKWYLPDELYSPQSVRTGGGITNLTGNGHLFSDNLGVVTFNHPGLRTLLETDAGDIVIDSRDTRVDGVVEDLLISDHLPFSCNPQTNTGTIFVGMHLNIHGQPVISGDSYRDAMIMDWTAINGGKLFLHTNHHIDVINSTINMSEVLLMTN